MQDRVAQAQQAAQELDDPTIRAAADQRQPDDRLAQPRLANASPNSTSRSGAAGKKAPANAAQALCVCWWTSVRLTPCRVARPLIAADRASA
ncbi:MAG TPA: hypothetical protein VGC15_10745 [Acetobacteraceae bacterium]